MKSTDPRVISEYKRFEGVLALDGEIRVGMKKEGTSTFTSTYLDTDRIKNLTVITDLQFPQLNTLIKEALKRIHGEDIDNKNVVMVFKKNRWKIGYSPDGLHAKIKDKLVYINPPFEDAEFVRVVSLMVLQEAFAFLSYNLNQAFIFGKMIDETNVYENMDGYG